MRPLHEVAREIRLLDFSQLVLAHFTGPHETTWDVEDCTAQLVLRTEPADRRLIILCTGVQRLTLRDFGGGVTQVMGLAIDDWRDRGLEDIAWKIHDFEDSKIEFFCKDAQGCVEEGW